MQPAAGSFSPNVSTMAITVPATSGTAAAAVDMAPARTPAPTELASIDVRRATEAAVPTAAMLGQIGLDQGQRRRARRRRRGGRRPDRRGDPPPAGEGADPGRLGVRRLGEPPGRTPAAEQAHRDGLHAHQAARREGAGERRRPADARRLLRPGPQGPDARAHRRPRRHHQRHRLGPARHHRRRVDVPDRRGDRRAAGGGISDDEGHVYHPMIIVVTDEVGDDESRLEEAIAAASAAKMPVYVLGSQALFGRVDGLHGLHRPEDQADLLQPPRPPGARERGAGADPPAVLVRRPAVRGPRRRASAPTP